MANFGIKIDLLKLKNRIISTEDRIEYDIILKRVAEFNKNFEQQTLSGF